MRKILRYSLSFSLRMGVLAVMALLPLQNQAQTNNHPFNNVMRACTAPSGQNSIYGVVYYDDNANGIKEGGELVYEGATVRLYADADSNGTPDGAAELTTVTDVNGEYHFDTTLVFSQSFVYNQRVGASTDDATEDPSKGQIKLTDAQIKVGKGGNRRLGGFRFTGMSIPSGAVIDSAFIIIDNGDTKADNTSVDIFGEDIASPLTFSTSGYDITNRTKTTNFVTFPIIWGPSDTDYSSPDIKSIIQELVTSYGGVNEVVLTFYENAGSGDECKIYSYDGSPSNAARLEVHYSAGASGAYHFITDVDVSTLPATSSLTTPTSQSAAFYATDVADCNNNLGFDIASPNTAPTAVDDNDNTTNVSSVNIDVLNNDSDSEGDDLTINAITSAPDQGGSAVINDNGTPLNPADDYIVFTPSGSYFGDETFQYEICDDGWPSECSTATVTVSIACVNDSVTVNETICDGDSTQVGSTWYSSAGMHVTVIPNAYCDSVVTLNLTVDPQPSAAVAGPDQDECGASSFTMAATSPAVGSGLWSIVSGSASITTPTSATSAVTGVAAGASVTLRWTVSSGVCTSNTDDVTITHLVSPTADAGPDQAQCNDGDFTMAGNTPAVGSGLWSLISGSATITTPASPTTTVTGLAAGSSATLRWTTTNASCVVTDDVVIQNDVPPTTAAAGPDQTLCNTSSFTMAGNTPVVGTGTWSIVSGSATITTPSSPSTTITAVSSGTSVTLRWTISTNGCPVSTDDVVIQNDGQPTSNAGPDQSQCNTSSFTMAGNTPTYGSGTWSIVSGSASITTPSSPTTTVTGVTAGTSVTLRWTTSNGVCTDATDDVTIQNDESATTSAAGTDQSACNTTAFTMAANTPVVGTGAWSIVSGSATITTPSSPTTTVTAVGSGATVTLRWTITNGSCASTDDVDVTNENCAPTAVNDLDSTDNATAISIDVLANDTDPEGHNLTITAISSAPDQGGSAVINDNGTAGNPADDFIDFTPSGAFTGDETFDYVICDDGSPNLCDTATVSVNIVTAPCIDGHTPESSPSWAFGAEWKYEDSGTDLPTTWADRTYYDCPWSYGNAELGFGDGDETTTITDNDGETYYFRKHFNVADADAVNNLFLEMRRDDGVVLYINGTELYRSNMPTGTIEHTTLASANQSGADETAIRAIVVPSNMLVDGDNVISAEVHQDLATSSDITWDLRMTPDMTGVNDTTLIEVNSNWNYNDNGTDLGTTWRDLSYTETVNEWEAGPAELGYGDGGEATVLGYGADANNKYPTYYFRQYFHMPSTNPTDQIYLRLQRDDGAVIYINGTEVWRDGMPAGAPTWSTYANQTIGGADETAFINTTINANTLVAGKNVVAVELHQTSGTSSDISFDFEMILIPGDPNNPPSAVADFDTTLVDAAIDIAVLGNDSDPDGNDVILSAISSNPNQGGTAVINNNGTPFNYTDDYIVYTPASLYQGTETFDYVICDNGNPVYCDTATVTVDVQPNAKPVAVDDAGTTPSNIALVVDVLSNDSDPNGNELTITGIASAPNHGGAAVINDNGTAGDPTDDYIDFTPSGLYEGIEVFDYIICDNGNPSLCDTATVTITIGPAQVCINNSTPETAPSFAFGAEWQYDTTGADLGTTWRTTAFNDDCWPYGNAELGFGDGDETTTIINNGVETYYFRKHFNVNESDSVNNLFLELKRDDGVVIYINGTELYRSNMPTGTVQHTTLASSNVGGVDESAIHAIVVPGSVLVDGDNVIAAEVHQDIASSTDITWDLRMTPDMVGANDSTLIELGSNWNFNDNGIDLGTTWRDLNYTETVNEWEAGPAELGYGDGGEATVLDYGADANNKYPTYYFRQYFNVPYVAPGSNLYLQMQRDDGAVVYINGTEVWRDGITGTPTYSTYANQTIGNADEVALINTIVDASTYLVPGKNVVAVEMHQVNATSSDISFDFEMSVIGGGTIPLARGPYLQTPTKNSVIVKWRTGIASESQVKYGTSLAAMNNTVTIPVSTTEHAVTIPGLTADTKYYYSIGAPGTVIAGADANHFFTTAPADNSEALTRAWILGDAGTANSDQRAVRDAYYSYVGSSKTDMILLLGDNAYNSGTDAQYQDAIFENMYEDKLINVPMWSCPGNHDLLSASSASQTGPYYDIFDFPTAAEAGGVASGTEAYYSWDYGQIHFVSLDSDDSPRNVGGAMLNWLTNDLAATTKQWIVVIFHHPPYTKGSHDSDSEGNLIDMRENVLPILESYGVDLVMSGHSHSYERSYLLQGHYGSSGTFNAGTHALDNGSGQLDVDCSYKKTTTGPDSGDGTVYVVAGSSGKVTGTLTAHPAMFTYLYQMGSVVMEVEENRMDVKFIKDDGSINDYFTIDKDVNVVTDTTVAEAQLLTLTASWLDDFDWNPGSQTNQSANYFPAPTDTLIIVSNANGCLSDTFNLNVIDADNVAPNAVNDTTVTYQETTVIVPVLNNDNDNSGLDASSVAIVTSPSKGTIGTINPLTGSIQYIPGVGQTGVDQFSYTVCDDGLPAPLNVLCDTAFVTVTILSNVPPVAVNDFLAANMNTPYDIDILANDTDADGNIDPSSVIITQQPSNGTITNVASDGVVSFSPDAGFFGIDQFKYRVKDLANALSNEATVNISVSCVAPAGNENEISGLVYFDANTNGSYDNGELPYQGASVMLYDDQDQNGTPDGGVLQTTTTNVLGGFTFDTLLTYSQSFQYDQRIASSGDDAYEDFGKADVKETDNDVKFGKADGSKLGAFRFTSLGIPSNATVTSAYLEVNNGENPGKSDVTSVDIHAEDAASPAVFSDANLISTRPTTTNFTPFSINWSGGEGNVQTGDLSAIIQELITSYGAIDEVAFIWENNAGSSDEAKILAYDDNPLLAARLVVDYEISGNTLQFLTEVDVNSLPATSSITSSQYQTSSFTAQGTKDCNNNFGFDIASPTPNNPPLAVNDNDTTVLYVALEMDVLANDSDPDAGQELILSSITAAPDNGGTAEIKNNGTPSDYTDDYVLYTPSGLYVGWESYTYQVCDNAFPNFKCSTATVNVHIIPNTDPVALDDADSTPMNVPLILDVLANDYDDYGQDITITTITSSPDRGGTAEIKNNGTPLDPSDDYILFTPSGLWQGIEKFKYQICDNGSPTLCDIAEVTIDVLEEACIPVAHTVDSDTWVYGAEWRCFDDDMELPTGWNTIGYEDAQCWDVGDAAFGFGDPVTSVINDHGGVTYYFRKDFNIADASAINYLKLDMKMDDGAVVYLNGNEIFRANMPNGDFDYQTQASGPVSEGKEYSITTSADPLVTGTNVIAVEVHQETAGDADLYFDLKMTPNYVNEADNILVYEGEFWNYNDNGLNLANTWKQESYREAENQWETGQGEFGYGDGDEVTILDYGPDANDKYITTYFRHYFTWNTGHSFDTLEVKLRRDDGAIVYLNGTQIAKDNLPGSVNYLTHSTTIISGADEVDWQIYKVLASSLNQGANSVAVEIHNRDGTSSDLSFDFEMSIIAGDPANASLGKYDIEGLVFLDADISRSFSSGDVGLGAIQANAYLDNNENGILDPSDPLSASTLTNYDGEFTLQVDPPLIRAVSCTVGQSSDDALEEKTTVYLSRAKEASIDLNSGTPELIFGFENAWSYYDAGDHGETDWMNASNNVGWKGPNNGNFGFQLIGELGNEILLNKTFNKDRTTYYFWKQVSLSAADAGKYLSAIADIRCDDGLVIYINGSEVARYNMPSAGAISYSTAASSKLEGAEEADTTSIFLNSPGFVTGTNTIAVEVHQFEPSNDADRDLHFDMRLYGVDVSAYNYGMRFNNLGIPKNAVITNASLTVKAATASTEPITISVRGEASGNAATFLPIDDNIDGRSTTVASRTWMSDGQVVVNEELTVDSLTSIIQEIVNLPTWISGNSLALITSGFSNQLFTYDGGYSAELIVSYVDETVTSADYLIALSQEDLSPVHLFMTDSIPVVTVSNQGRAPSVFIGYIGGTSSCVTSSDDSYDALHIVNRFSGKNMQIGEFGGATEIEAIALSENADTLYAADGGAFGTVELLTGAFTPYGNTIGSGDGSLGTITFSDIDGLAFDLTRGIMWATHRITGTGNLDVLLVVDPLTGLLVPDYFGAGVDYLVPNGTGILEDLDDIAVNPNTGNLFAMNNDNGGITNLIEIIPSTGAATIVSNTGLDDLEGQGFHNDGLFYTTSGRVGSPTNSLYEVDTGTAALTYIGHFDDGGDFEGCDCKSGPYVSFIQGVVFHDVNEDSTYNAGDIADSNVRVYLFEDIDGDGLITGADLYVGFTTTDADGVYAFGVFRPGNFLATANEADLPADFTYTTTSPRQAQLRVTGSYTFSNNIGYRYGATLPVELSEFTGENRGLKNHLYWTTLSEVNSDYFDVERSSNGFFFEKIGKVDAAGTTTEVHDYTFIDEEPFRGENYYRLNQVDFDGANEYSRTIMLRVETVKGVFEVETWPNPATNSIRVNGLEGFDSESLTLRVYDNFGREYFSQQVDPNDLEAVLDISDLRNGFYLIGIEAGTMNYSIPFIKQE